MNRQIIFVTVLACMAAALLCAVTDLYAVVIPSDVLCDAVKHYVIEAEGNKTIELEVTVPRAFDVEVDSVDEPTLHVTSRQEGRRGRNYPVSVDITDDDGNVLRTIRLVARLKTFAQAAVVTKNLKRGETVEPGDIEILRVDVAAFDDFYDGLDGILGKTAKRQLRAGTVLRPSHLRDPYLIKRGDRVTVEIREDDFMVRAKGTARENGCKGEEINVLIDMTKAVISCMIVGSDTVIVGGRS